jgi:Ser/Thr protein kinase RdoA (MazF antagonist)
MNGSFFPVKRSLLSASALAEWVKNRYRLPGFPSCQFWRRSINDLYLIQAHERKLVLRISPTDWRSYEHLAAEIDLLIFLDQHHITVPQPIPDQDGAYIQTLNAPEGPRFAVAFSFVPGVPHSPTKAHSYRFGQAIARLHAATDGYPADQAAFRFEATDMVEEPLARLKPLFTHHQDDFDYLVEISKGLKQAAGKLSRQAPEYGVCHGDVNDNNFHVDADHRWGLLDFEYFGYGWRVFDIGTFFNNQIHQQGRTERTRTFLDAFLEGYQSVRPLSQTELDVLPSFVILRQIWLLGIGARNFPVIGLNLFEDWVFEKCIPFIRWWIEEPWYGPYAVRAVHGTVRSGEW